MSDLFLKGKRGAVTLNLPELRRILHAEGYRMYSIDSMNRDFMLCKETSNRLFLANLDSMWKMIEDYATCDEEMQKIMMEQKSVSGSIVKTLDKVEAKPYKDPRHKCSLFFKNGVLSVNRNDLSHDITTWDKADLGGCKVWGNSVINKDVDLNLLSNYKDGMFYKFCVNVAGVNGIDPLMRSIGYMIHSYKDPDRPYIMVYSDGNEKDNSKSNGGTGKSLIITECLSRFRSISTIDGKKYKSDRDFNFQNVDGNSDVIIIDDVLQNFNYSSLYPSVTGTMTIEKKGKTPEQIPYSRSPKIAITSNFGIIANGGSDKRRRRVIGVTNYYGAHKTPHSDFGCLFFEDWNGDREIEWQYFFGFIVECIKMYFDRSVDNYNHTSIETRALANAQNPALLDYCLCNYMTCLGEEVAKSNKDWSTEVQEVLELNKREKGYRELQRTMESIGITRVTIKNPFNMGNGKSERRHYFTITDKEKLNEILADQNLPLFTSIPEMLFDEMP